ncbi:hypothetical protein AN237_24945 (plasmid) [Raoultella ornithinolytica]|nr:hypothetical protein AN237_24945 [Raoultella ornithinolytica]
MEFSRLIFIFLMTFSSLDIASIRCHFISVHCCIVSTVIMNKRGEVFRRVLYICTKTFVNITLQYFMRVINKYTMQDLISDVYCFH